MRELSSQQDIRRVLVEARTVAVLGANPRPDRPAHFVPDYLHRQGYRILPVNPTCAGQLLWGERVRATLSELAEAVDVVEVFRRSELIPQHLPDILAMRPPPRVVWLQSGIRHDGAARQLVTAGIEVVQDRCMLAEHGRLGLGPIGR